MKVFINKCKLVLIILMPITLLILSLLIATWSLPQINKLMINAYIEICQEMLFIEINKEEIKNPYGFTMVSFNGNMISMKTSFLYKFIVNTDVIEEFMFTINWSNIILEHAFNLDDVQEKESILQLYLQYIKDMELIYNRHITTKSNIFNGKALGTIALHKYINELYVDNSFKAFSIEEIQSFVDKVDWVNYIKTQDVSSENFHILKYHFFLYSEEMFKLNYNNDIQQQELISNLNYFMNSIVSLINCYIIKESFSLFLSNRLLQNSNAMFCYRILINFFYLDDKVHIKEAIRLIGKVLSKNKNESKAIFIFLIRCVNLETIKSVFLKWEEHIDWVNNVD